MRDLALKRGRYKMTGRELEVLPDHGLRQRKERGGCQRRISICRSVAGTRLPAEHGDAEASGIHYPWDRVRIICTLYDRKGIREPMTRTHSDLVSTHAEEHIKVKKVIHQLIIMSTSYSL